ERDTAAQVHDREAVEGVAIQADHRLLIDRRRHPLVLEHIHTTCIPLDVEEHPVGLGADEIVDVHEDAHTHVLYWLFRLQTRVRTTRRQIVDRNALTYSFFPRTAARWLP
ncbi:hypothetical protein, partial [Pseudonocardia sulfidoxydans]